MVSALMFNLCLVVLEGTIIGHRGRSGNHLSKTSSSRPLSGAPGRVSVSYGVALALVLSLVFGGALSRAQSNNRTSSDLDYADMQVDPWTLRQAADGGDARSAFLLGTRYASGRGGVRDDSQALAWFRKAAELGLPEAQYNLALMFATGRGTPKNMDAALRWVRQAALEELPQAQRDLGLLYMAGRHVKADPVEAAKWFHAAAEQGDEKAQFHLARLYETSRELGLSADKALEWYERAASLGFQPAADRLAKLQRKLGVTPVTSEPRRSTTSALTQRLKEPRAKRSPLPPGEFTIQLANYKGESGALSAVTKHKLGRAAWVVETQTAERRGWVVLYGAYASRADAADAVEGMPKALREGGTWIRKVSKIEEQRVE